MISFVPLHPNHFQLLCQWLNEPHVACWWSGPQTLEAVIAKYATYTKNFKLVDDTPKPIEPFIIMHDGKTIGYIQVYNARDFLDGNEDPVELSTLPESLAAVDFFIGEPSELGKGLGSRALCAFLEQHVWPHFQACLVDPDAKNKAAIRVYEKAGFVAKTSSQKEILFMVAYPKMLS